MTCSPGWWHPCWSQREDTTYQLKMIQPKRPRQPEPWNAELRTTTLRLLVVRDSCPPVGFPTGSAVKNPPAMQEMWVWFLGREDPLEEGLATHSSVLAGKNAMDRGARWATGHGARVGHDSGNWARTAHPVTFTASISTGEVFCYWQLRTFFVVQGCFKTSCTSFSFYLLLEVTWTAVVYCVKSKLKGFSLTLPLGSNKTFYDSDSDTDFGVWVPLPAPWPRHPPPRNSPSPAGCPTIQLNSGAIYLEITLYPQSYGLSLVRLPPPQYFRGQLPAQVITNRL